MKGFLFKILFFGLIVLVVGSIAEFYYAKNNLNPFWGSGLFEDKLLNYKEHYSNSNHLFLGPSIFYRQIISDDFDKQLTENQETSKSYNLSIVGLTPPEDLFLLDKILDQEWAHSKTFFLALTQVKGLSTTNLFKDRTSYYLNHTTLSLILREYLQSDQSFHTKVYVATTYLANYLYKVFSLSAFRKITLKGILEEPESSRQLWQKGFLALDDDPTQANSNRTSKFLKEVDKLQKRAEKLAQVYSNENQPQIKTPQFEYIKELINKAKSKNTNIIFVLPPRLKDYSKTYPLSLMLPKENIIDLANPSTYPEFYQVENSFDIGHLNKKGAKLFTRRLVEEYLKIKNL